ncbi:acyl carrier protein [Streptomyces sp. NPDC052701]|uniref:acyl carrier protein n=1 Tax=Streptomyces sp. NPDC052701 TaxID=3155533 RepID=UPI003425AAE5
MDARFVETLTPFLPFLHGETITEDTPLRTYGLDSMQAIELMFALEDSLGVSLPDEALVEETFATAGSLWRATQAAQGTDAVTATAESV